MELINTITNNRIWHRHGERIVWAIALTCLLIVLVSIGWTVYKQNKIRTANYQPKDVKPVVASQTSAYRVNDIVAANLFGDPNPRVVVKKAPKTTLNLTLQGILSATDNSMARAIIQSGKKRSELYSIGESIKGAGASVKEIRDGEVLLNRNGVIESLPLQKKADSGNRQLITYQKSASEKAKTSIQHGSNRQPNRSQNGSNTRTNRSTPIAKSPNGAPRKIRKPNFSGLDRALKKMGEL